MILCSNCGKEIKEDAKFCANCGIALNISLAPEIMTGANSGVKSDQKSIIKKKSPIKILAIAATVIVVLAGAFLCFPIFSSKTVYDSEDVYVSSDDIHASDDVYACGYVDHKAVYWKNGQLVELSDSGATPYKIFVSGNDVYVCGEAPGKPIYWKNGELVELPIPKHG
jgi:hypothetical protein